MSPGWLAGRLGVVPPADVMSNLDARLARENDRIDVLMFSGGEPTLYPHLAQLLRAVRERDVVRILVNTNGVRIALPRVLRENAGSEPPGTRVLPEDAGSVG